MALKHGVLHYEPEGSFAGMTDLGCSAQPLRLAGELHIQKSLVSDAVRRNQSGQLGYSRQVSGRYFKRLQDASGTFFTATDAVGNADSGEAVSGELQSWVLIRESFDLSHQIQVTHAVLGHRPCMAFDKCEQRRLSRCQAVREGFDEQSGSSHGLRSRTLWVGELRP